MNTTSYFDIITKLIKMLFVQGFVHFYFDMTGHTYSLLHFGRLTCDYVSVYWKELKFQSCSMVTLSVNPFYSMPLCLFQ